MVQYAVPAEGRQPYDFLCSHFAATKISCALPDEIPTVRKSFQL